MAASLTSPSPRWNPWKLGGLPWKTFFLQLWQESQKDEILGRAAQLAYYFLLALFPALLFLTAFMGLFPLTETLPELMQYLRTVLPADALSLLERYLENVVQGSGGDILSLGLLGTLWASSSGVTAIMEALNVVYGAEETRPYWKVRLIAILLTVGLAGFIILSITLILYGARIGEWIADIVGLGWLFLLTWNVLQWPVAVLLMLFALAIIYYVCPNVEHDWRWVTPGSVCAVSLWLLVSLGFKAYVEHFGNYNAAYGSIAGVIVLMLWLYLTGVVMLLGEKSTSRSNRPPQRSVGANRCRGPIRPENLRSSRKGKRRPHEARLSRPPHGTTDSPATRTTSCLLTGRSAPLADHADTGFAVGRRISLCALVRVLPARGLHAGPNRPVAGLPVQPADPAGRGTVACPQTRDHRHHPLSLGGPDRGSDHMAGSAAGGTGSILC